MISYRQADIIDRVRDYNNPLGIVRVVQELRGNSRCITGYLLELKRGAGSPKQIDATVKFADDVWASLPAIVTNAYQQNPQGFIEPFPSALTLTMVSEVPFGHPNGMQPSPDFISTAIEKAFKNWGIPNTETSDSSISSSGNVSVVLVGEYHIRWTDIPESFKTVQADLAENLNKKREWKEHRINRAVDYIFDLWSRFWGHGNEHSAGELYSTLIGNLPNKAIQDSFTRVMKEETPLMLPEIQEFLADPERKAMFLEAFLAKARSIGDYDNHHAIRQADLVNMIRQNFPNEFQVRFVIEDHLKQFRFTSIQPAAGITFTNQIQERRDYIEEILVRLFRNEGMIERDNNWVKTIGVNTTHVALTTIGRFRRNLVYLDGGSRIVSSSDELDDGNGRWHFNVGVK